MNKIKADQLVDTEGYGYLPYPFCLLSSFLCAFVLLHLCGMVRIVATKIIELF